MCKWTGWSVTVEGAQKVAAEDRNQKRLERLRSMEEAGTYNEACLALRQIHDASELSPAQILIRSGFARLSQPLDTEVYSDRRVPKHAVRPLPPGYCAPAAALCSSF
jgi:hypothetical protein